MVFECTIEALMNGDNDPHYDVQLISLLHQIANTFNHSNYPGWKQTLQDRGITDALRDFASRYKQSNDYAYTKLRMLLRSLEVETVCVVSSQNTTYFFHSCCRKNAPFLEWHFLILCKGVSTKEGKRILMRTIALLWLLFLGCQSILIYTDKTYLCSHVNSTFGLDYGYNSMFHRDCIPRRLHGALLFEYA